MKDEETLDERWRLARSFAALLGEPASSFSTAIRECLISFETLNDMSVHSRWQIFRLLKSKRVLAPFYYATQTFKGNELNSYKVKNLQDITMLYKPIELAAILADFYYYTQARKLADKTEFEILEADLHTKCEISALIGMSIPQVGLAIGIITPFIRQIALSTFLIHDPKGYTDYRRELKLNSKLKASTQQIARWGTTDAEIAVALLINIGFATEFVTILARGFGVLKYPKLSVNVSGYKVKCVEDWTNHIMTGKALTENYPEEYTPTNLEELKETVKMIAENESVNFWMKQSKSSISPESTPKLFKS